MPAKAGIRVNPCLINYAKTAIQTNRDKLSQRIHQNQNPPFKHTQRQYRIRGQKTSLHRTGKRHNPQPDHYRHYHRRLLRYKNKTHSQKTNQHRPTRRL